jgi:hypothetical protein
VTDAHDRADVAHPQEIFHPKLIHDLDLSQKSPIYRKSPLLNQSKKENINRSNKLLTLSFITILRDIPILKLQRTVSKMCHFLVPLPHFICQFVYSLWWRRWSAYQ